ncbi:acetaldehyde dehydrogenase (acetylating) [Paenibacillus dendritiformis]|uniref:acetaldehyde dehydrogenase (acetylating) n=1 Tax=Paenibacillus dendritiformis TaxID=130049 RepID=UPI00248BD374|nr:acetaldehyde dehydrogenase (acetylating) [Paenibacillus dendritiformis]WGU93820.1 acetaldehyde dehydrogenase (acetylating) [Paenibacillus dendritiformis]
MMLDSKLKVAILGSGNIGTDLLMKTIRSPYLECTYFIGRHINSSGIQKAMSLGIRVSDQSIDALINDPDSFELVFDATSAASHKIHAPIIRNMGKLAIDLTPSNIGEKCVPAVNLDSCINYNNVNMVTCGGQASIPLAYAIGQTQKDVEYIEVVSSIASKSAGPATRNNLDEYIETTEQGISLFSGCKKVKAILNLNPANPCIDMQTTVFALVKSPDLKKLTDFVNDLVKKMQKYVPGYQLLVPPTIENGRIVIMVRVQGLGDFLPAYAGNLDIINCAAIAMAEEHALARMLQKRGGYHAESINK